MPTLFKRAFRRRSRARSFFCLKKTDDSRHSSLGIAPTEMRAMSGQGGQPGREDGKIELTEDDVEEMLGYNFRRGKKWTILLVVTCIQVSMNSNAGMYGFAVDGMVGKYGVSPTIARLGQPMFLIAYAFGCELWAPWSEELGRRKTQQLSLFLVNIWNILNALSPTFGGVLVGRILAGLSTAGGSVTLGVLADMYREEDPGFQEAIAFVVLSSVGGAPVGAIIGGFVKYQHADPSWIFWVLLIMGGVAQLLHLALVPETRSTIIIDREARWRRKAKEEPDVYGPNELKDNRFSGREILKIMWRPFQMLITEPIVTWLSLLSGFSDSLIFTFMEAFNPIFTRYGFNSWQIGLSFSSSLIGYLIAYLTHLPVIRHHNTIRAVDPDRLAPESRLWWLLFIAPGLPGGLFGFSFTSLGPAHVHWIVPLIFTMVIAAANYTIYKSTIDYMVAAYGPFAASATGGNDFARDFLAGIAGLYAHPFYSNVGTDPDWHLVWPTLILACLAIPVTIPIYVFYYKGPELRLSSPFAMELEKARQARIRSRLQRAWQMSREQDGQQDGQQEEGVV